MSKTSIIRVIAGLAFALVPFSAWSAAPLTLESAITIATQQSPDVQIAESKASIADWTRFARLWDHLPKLEAQGNHYLSSKYSISGIKFGGVPAFIPGAYPQTEFGIEASMLLFDGLGTFNHYRAAALEAEASQIEATYERFKLERTVRMNFFQALAARELLAVAAQNIETLEQHLHLVNAGQRAGIGTRVDVLRIESQLEEARAEQILDQDQVMASRQLLFETLGTDLDASAEIQGTLPIPSTEKISPTLTLAVNEHPEIKAAALRDDAADRERTSERGNWFPKVTIFGQKSFYKFGDFDPAIIANSHFLDSSAVGLRMTWTLFDGARTVAQPAIASARRAIEAQRKIQIDLSVPHRFDDWKRKYIFNAALYFARKRTVQKSEESVRLAVLSLKAGTKTHSEVLDAELDLFRARAGMIRAQVDAVAALAQLELFVGHPL